MKNKKRITNLILIFSFAFFAFKAMAFTAPYVFEPLDSGPTGQSKQGGMIINTSGSPFGLIIPGGKVGIGTTSPNNDLEVNGSAKINDIYTNDGVQIQGLSGRNYFRDAEGAGNLRVGAAWGMAGIYAESGTAVVGGTGGVSLQNNSMFVSTNGNVGLGTNGPSTKLDVRGKSLFTRDGVGECCGNDATITIGENTAGTGRKSSISFHNGGRHEGTLELAPDGERRFRIFDNQGAKMGLEATGYLRSQTGVCIGGDCRSSWPIGQTWWEYYYSPGCPGNSGYYLRAAGPLGGAATVGSIAYWSNYDACYYYYSYYYSW